MYVIRSMSTTDATPREEPVPYHIYLLKPEKRARAYWSRDKSDAAMFPTPEEAQAHAEQALSNGCFDIVPCRDEDLPTYWDERTRRAKERFLNNVMAC
ncbi:MAG: hypothetical protein DI537_10545 [Stutzerimonas stutzeri]|nr:MAG: hypothetical protein DI537_10545 [Stutzerimonas stutzeri]